MAKAQKLVRNRGGGFLEVWEEDVEGSGHYTPIISLEGLSIGTGDLEIGGVEIKDGSTDTRAKVKSDGTDNALAVYQNAPTVPGLNIPKHDYVGMTYTGDDLTTVVYKTGGSGGTTVATVTMTYSAGKLLTITRS